MATDFSLLYRERSSEFGKNIEDCRFQFSDSYPVGGESVDSFIGIKRLNKVWIEQDKLAGHKIRYDYTNNKLRVYMTNVPPVVHEELITITDDVGYLAYPAAFVQFVAASTAAADAAAYAPYLVIPGGLTPITLTVAVDMGINLTTGVFTQGQKTKLTFKATDSIIRAKVSYITQAWKDVTDNVVQLKMTGTGTNTGTIDYGGGATAGFATNVLKLGTDVVAIQSITWLDGGAPGTGTVTAMTPLIDDAANTNDTEVTVDFAKATTFGEMTFDDTDAVDTADDEVYVTYVKNPGSGFLNERFDQTAIASA